jgi:peptidoglycan hydrolase-like protein with peptidoglycan-binding domain
MKKSYISLAVLTFMLGLVSFGIVHVAKTAEAETYTTTSTSSVSSGCLVFDRNMGMGETSGQVIALQNFLNGNGYMAYSSTGYFGPITFAAVTRFQAAYGISTTGFVGPLTRAQIQAYSCNNVPPIPVPNKISISSMAPSAGPVGTSVTIMGTGFTNDNTIYIAGGAIQHVPATTIYTYSNGIVCNGYPNCSAPLQSITFTVPSAIGQYCAPGMYCIMLARVLNPGTYDIVVGNDTYGKSNAAKFTVTDTGMPLSIQGIDGPNQLSMTVPGTWTVRTTGASGTLRYSVLWGDEMYYPSAGIMMPTPMPVSGTATFTHAYQRAGTFAPTFTVSDDYGHSVTTSMSVLVTPIY